MSIKITTDSTADLTPELLERYQIEVLPLTINLGDKGYRDGLEISRDDIFRHVDAGGDLPKTSAVSVAEFHDCFTRLSPLHEAVINVDIGSKMSACYQNACIAAEEFDNVYVIDSGLPFPPDRVWWPSPGRLPQLRAWSQGPWWST